MYNSSSGNVLFLILIAVALFAALSYAVTNSTRSDGKNVNAEQVRLVVNQFEQFKSSLTQSYIRLILNGCSEESINLVTPLTTAMMLSSHGTSGVLGDNCDLFSKNGGGVIPPNNEGVSSSPIYFNNPQLRLGVPMFADWGDIGALTANADLVVLMSYDTTDEYVRKVCKEINKRQGMPDIDDTTAVNDLMMNGKLPTDLFCNDQFVYIVVHPH